MHCLSCQNCDVTPRDVTRTIFLRARHQGRLGLPLVREVPKRVAHDGKNLGTIRSVGPQRVDSNDSQWLLWHPGYGAGPNRSACH